MRSLTELKKWLISISLFGLIIGGVTVGTFSWFLSSALVEGKIQNAQLEINVLDGAAGIEFLSEHDRLVLGKKVISKPLTFVNSGDEAMKVSGKLDIDLIHSGEKNAPNNKLKDVLVTVKIKQNGNVIDTFETTGDKMGDKNILRKFSNGMEKSETFEVEMTMELKKNPGNKLQDLSVKPSILVEAKQIDSKE
ncbi:hypothetical protein AB685_21480 [Bacillus sp. LL01]|uniref:hypothetical protein n=1 Tax=Bacillus sp. LL01 TaxID=1665556 RepID=UPI00064D6B0E|nr:hypothetical protein [Bacillus sp. LL01]KMJ56501.1 hypothetical protein AB685_21480 [Bacillus sp. LL01]